MEQHCRNSRDDAYVDNQAVVFGWERERSKDMALNDIRKDIFKVCLTLNIDLHLIYVPSSQNIADRPSRELLKQDTMLGKKLWEEVQSRFGPHTFDLMSLDSNVQISTQGTPLPHFTPWSL